MKPLASFDSPVISRRLLLFLVVALAVLPAHFLHLRSLGVYEDDYWAIVPFLDVQNTTLPFLSAKASSLLEYVKYHFSTWMTGRPLNYVLPAVIASVGSQLAGLDGVYLLTGSALLMNCFLLYWIARRYVSIPSAMFGAVFYGLYPADTTKILLVHGTHVQTSVTFLLMAVALFLSAKPTRWLSYPVAALSLLSYESAYLPFILAPALLFSPTRAWIKRGTLHLILCMGTLAIIAAIRLSKGDSRAASVAGDLSEALFRSFTSLFIGPKTSGYQLWAGPFESLSRVDMTGWLVALVAALGLVVFWRAYGNEHPDIETEPSSPGFAGRPYLVLASCGLIFWAASYALTLVDPHYPPVRTFGRLTSVHVAGGFGATLFCVGLVDWARRIIPKKLLFPFSFILAGYVGLLASHGYAVQRGYIHAWQEEQRFWSQVLKLAPDLKADTAILVTGHQPPQGLTIASNSWSDALVLQYFFQRPHGTEPPVLVMLNNSGTLIDIHASGSEIRWKPFFWSGVEKTLDPANVIVLQSDYGTMSRIEKVYIPGIDGYLHSKPLGTSAAWPHSFFYHEMFGRSPGKL